MNKGSQAELLFVWVAGQHHWGNIVFKYWYIVDGGLDALCTQWCESSPFVACVSAGRSDWNVCCRLILEFELRTKEESGLVLYMARINHADFVSIQVSVLRCVALLCLQALFPFTSSIPVFWKRTSDFFLPPKALSLWMNRASAPLKLDLKFFHISGHSRS